MFLTRYVAAFLLLCASCSNVQDHSNLKMPVQVPLTFTIEKDVFFARHWNVAVVDLNYNYEKEGQVGPTHWVSNGSNGGRVVAGLLASELAKLDNISVVERGAMDKVLAEQALQLSGVVDTETSIKIGRIVGAEAVLTGELTDYVLWDNPAGYGSTIACSIRMIDVQSGNVILSSAISRSRLFMDVLANCQLTIAEIVVGIQKQE
ncbi:MAG: hypothetical protein GY941_07475 [Planctomycetes bacterium]|nr:hypothetical protein [Planctomycetota bacterium]